MITGTERSDPAAFVRRIHEQFLKRKEDSRIRESVAPEPREWSSHVKAARREFERLYQLRSAVGRMPPNPGTVRARLSARLISLIQRALFWYTPPILEFQSAVSTVLGELCELQWREWQWTQAAEERLARLELQAESRQKPGADVSLASSSRAGDSEPPPAVPSGLDEFYLRLLERFRGSEDDVARKLQVYLEAVRCAAPPRAPWLDLGCGRGEWLKIAGAAGYDVSGIDSSPAAVRTCRRAGLRASCAAALESLQSLPAGSLGLVSAFHVIEHWDFERTFDVVREAARVLLPGGVLVLETPHASNATTATHDFWRDPTHRHIVPPELLDFLLEHHGFHVFRRFQLNPASEAEQLPFRGLEVVDRLNAHFYGPRDYGILARR